MYKNKKVVVVMPAYNAALTLEKTFFEVKAQDVVDEIIIVDDCSDDNTQEVASRLPGAVFCRLEQNLGYGGNQKKCYRIALEHGADIVIMVHPDYQYTPLLIPAMAMMIGSGLYECVIASRILGGRALQGGMPRYKYISNRALTFFQNLLQGAKLSEYHTGYRGFSAELLRTLDLEGNSDDFIFDNQMLAQIIWRGVIISEISCPTLYFEEASSINFVRSLRYGLGCLGVSLMFAAARAGIYHNRLYPAVQRGVLHEKNNAV